MKKELNIGFTIKTILDAITLSSLNEIDGEKFYESNKKKYQRMKDYSFEGMNETEIENYISFIEKIDKWSSWATEKGYLKGYQQTAMSDFFIIMTEVAIWNMPLNQNMIEHFICYALAKVLYKQIQEYKKVNPNDNKYWSMYYTLANYDFFISDENYKTDLLPIRNSFLYLESIVKNMNDVIRYWEDKLAELGKSEVVPNLKSYINKWKTGTVPSWNVIRLFLDNDLYLPDEYFIEAEEVKDRSYFYKSFRANLFMSFIIIKMFESLEKRKILSEDSRSMIRNGVRLYYRDFYIIRNKSNEEYSEKIETEALNNLMFRTLFCMLDGTLSEIDTVEFMKTVEINPEFPIVANTSEEINLCSILSKLFS